MSSSQSDRVHMPVRIDKSRCDNLVRAIYDLGSRKWLDILCYLLNFVTGDKDIRLNALGSIILLVDNNSASTKENPTLGSHSGERANAVSSRLSQGVH